MPDSAPERQSGLPWRRAPRTPLDASAAPLTGVRCYPREQSHREWRDTSGSGHAWIGSRPHTQGGRALDLVLCAELVWRLDCTADTRATAASRASGKVPTRHGLGAKRARFWLHFGHCRRFRPRCLPPHRRPVRPNHLTFWSPSSLDSGAGGPSASPQQPPRSPRRGSAFVGWPPARSSASSLQR